ncbi:MAG: PIN domain-containing protein [Verrucomicrobiaceae bacterium]
MTLVDSSICVGYLRKILSPEANTRFSTLILDGHIAINPVIWAELYSGVRGKREDHEFNDLVSLCHPLKFDDECWQKTAEISRRCIRAGINVPFSDIQIQACADRYRIELFHNDKHFDLIQSHAS